MATVYTEKGLVAVDNTNLRWAFVWYITEGDAFEAPISYPTNFDLTDYTITGNVYKVTYEGTDPLNNGTIAYEEDDSDLNITVTISGNTFTPYINAAITEHTAMDINDVVYYLLELKLNDNGNSPSISHFPPILLRVTGSRASDSLGV